MASAVWLCVLRLSPSWKFEPEKTEIEAPKPLRRYLVEKGSVAVDGVSLTVADVRETSFTVWTIPHTREITTMGLLRPGDHVNIECDLLGKYIERLLEARGRDNGD